jgi:hypothetical protein
VRWGGQDLVAACGGIVLGRPYGLNPFAGDCFAFVAFCPAPIPNSEIRIPN